MYIYLKMLGGKRVAMGRPSHLRNPKQTPIILERDRLAEFKELCQEQGLSVSEGIRQLIEGELEKKVIGGVNPLNITYHKQAEKPLQMGLDHWIKRSDAFESIKTMDPHFIENIGINMVVAARFKKTGIAREVKVI